MSSAELTLTALFHQAGAGLRAYDIGRRLKPLSNDEFERIEQLQTPYPSPYLHHAYLALMFWNPSNTAQNSVWFLKLPLDEQGYMIPTVRDDLVNRLIANVQSSVNGLPAEDSLKDNPFMFKPTPEKMAIFHARAAQDAGQPVSMHFESVAQYINAGAANWQEQALQGLADLVVRMQGGPLEIRLAEQLESLPEGFTTQLLGLLEHTRIGTQLSQALNKVLDQTLNQASADPLKVALLLRALSASESVETTQLSVTKVLNSEAGTDIEVLTTIATRCETALMLPVILVSFLEALARSESDQKGFSRILAELMFLPVHRVLIVQALRNPNLSERLKQATDLMFGENFRQGRCN